MCDKEDKKVKQVKEFKQVRQVKQITQVMIKIKRSEGSVTFIYLFRFVYNGSYLFVMCVVT